MIYLSRTDERTKAGLALTVNPPSLECPEQTPLDTMYEPH